MLNWLGSLLTALLLLQDCTHGLRLVEVRIPNYVIKGSAAQLECLYDLDGESLYSVKWYKDGNEFYRYLPRDMPPAQTFLLPGVLVDLHNSSDAIVTLRNVNLQSSGRFRCEVSGEAPSFQTVTEHGDMVVVSLPDQGPPKISGGRPRYQIGEWVSINCTAGRSKPAVQLSWYVNGEQAEPHTLRKYPTIISGREALETSVLGLQFRVEQQHFRNGDMKLKCIASLSTFYWRSNEESVEGDRPQKAPVLESRETVYASNSRADPVQASKTEPLFAAHAPSLFVALCVASLVASGCLQQLFLVGADKTTKSQRQQAPKRQEQKQQQAPKQQEQQRALKQQEQKQQHKALPCIRTANQDKRQFVESQERNVQNESIKTTHPLPKPESQALPRSHSLPQPLPSSQPEPIQARSTKTFNKEAPICPKPPSLYLSYPAPGCANALASDSTPLCATSLSISAPQLQAQKSLAAR